MYPGVLADVLVRVIEHVGEHGEGLVAVERGGGSDQPVEPSVASHFCELLAARMVITDELLLADRQVGADVGVGQVEDPQLGDPHPADPAP